MDINGAVRLLLLLFLIINTYWDMKRRRVLLWSIVLFGISGIGLVLWFKNVSILSSMGGLAFGLLIGGCGYISRQAIGYGDGLVITVCGVYLGFVQVFAMVFYGLLFCSFLSMILIAAKKRTYKTQVPFLPYLLAGYVYVNLFS